MSRRRQSAGLDSLEENEEPRRDGGGQYRRDPAVLADLQKPRGRLPLRGVEHRGREQPGVGPGVRKLYVMSLPLPPPQTRAIDPSSLFEESRFKVTAARRVCNLWDIENFRGR